MNELEAMTRALALARQGWGRVHPNPLVGAVVLQGSDVAGEGFHAEFGGDHAEVAALRAAGGRARGGTLVVTLEPCGHSGKQPPCAEACLAAGIRRVVFAAPDPNPAAAGGSERLRAAGIDVESGLLRCLAEQQNAAFLHRFRRPARPWVALKLATSLDFRIADGSGRGDFGRNGSYLVMRHLRHAEARHHLADVELPKGEVAFHEILRIPVRGVEPSRRGLTLAPLRDARAGSLVPQPLRVK